MKTNPLTGKGVHRIHQLSPSGRRRFKQVVGREVRPDDYDGVHTTTDHSIASAYAISAWRMKMEKDDCPAVVHLDTDGLEPLPDVDAMMTGTEIYSEIKYEVMKLVREGYGASQIAEYYDSFGFEPSFTNLVGMDPAAVVFDIVSMYPGNPIELLISRSKYDPDQAIRRFVELGEVPSQALSEIVRQRRFDFEFDIDRVKRIDCILPWWKEIVDEDDLRRVEAIEEAGWDVITFDDAASEDIRANYKIVYGDEGTDDMHGTTMSTLRKAFPSLSSVLSCFFEVAPEHVVESKIGPPKGIEVYRENEDEGD